MSGEGSAEELGILQRHGQGCVERLRGLEDPILPLSARLACSSFLYLRSAWKVNTANFVCGASQKFATSISNSTPCNVPSSIQAYDVPVYETKHERRLSSVPLSLEEKVRLLAMVDVFEALSEEELERLARLAAMPATSKERSCPNPKKAVRNSTCSRRGASSYTLCSLTKGRSRFRLLREEASSGR
jgi:hypothetical protein